MGVGAGDGFFSIDSLKGGKPAQLLLRGGIRLMVYFQTDGEFPFIGLTCFSCVCGGGEQCPFVGGHAVVENGVTPALLVCCSHGMILSSL